MKICMIVGAFPPAKCGVGDYTSILCNRLAKKGLDVSIITTVGYGVDSNSNFKIYPILENWNFSCLNKIRNLINEIKPNIVHIQYPTNEYKKSIAINILPFFLKKIDNNKVVITMHEYSTYSIKSKIRNVLNVLMCHCIHVVNKEYENEIKRYSKYLRRKLKFIYIPVASNIPKCKLTEANLKKLKNDIDVKEEQLLISFFGFISEPKGVDDLIKALGKLKENKIAFKLLCIGKLNLDNPYHNIIKKLIEENQLSDNIIWTDFIADPSEVAKFLALSDVCVLPFKKGLDIKNASFLAAVNQGIQVITTYPKNHINFDYKNITYIKEKNPIEIYNALIKIKINDKIKVYSSNIPNWETISDSMISLYNNILNEE